MVGLEPTTTRFEAWHSDPLSYIPAIASVSQLASQLSNCLGTPPPGFEPGTVALEERCSHPLSYGGMGLVVSVGFEPTTYRLSVDCSAG